MSLTFGEPTGSGSSGTAIDVMEPEDVLGIGLGTDILLVDDDGSNLLAYEAALGPLGRTCVSVQSGMEALAKLLDQDFALILLDVTMPGMSGLETAQLLRQRPRCRGTPIIFITGMAASNDIVLQAYEAGAFDFVVKPVLPEILRAKASVYLRLQERTEQVLAQAKSLRDAHRRIEDAEQQERTRSAAAGTARRLDKLQEATAALAEARTPSDVAAVAVQLGAEALGASAGIMWFGQDDGSLVLGGSHAVPAAYLEAWRTIPAGASLPALRVLNERRPLWVENEADYAREVPEAIEQARAANRAWAFATLPLVSDGKGIAVLNYSYQGEHTFSEDERSFVLALVRTCEQALERSRLYVAEAEARMAAQSLNQRKDEFLAMLGHELRNPLSVMTSALELVKSRDGAMNREMSVLDRQVTHLTHIVGDLVAVSRITQGKITLQRETVDLAIAVTNVIEASRSSIDRHRHEVQVDIPDRLLLDADRHRLDQVLTNLIMNAATYTPDGGRIEISAEDDGPAIRLSIRDNGRGIPASLLPNVFELFVQGERAPARQEGGLGIGLTLVRTIVSLHGGTVEALSDGPGLGATFSVRWPRASSRTRTAKISALIRPAGAAPLRVLIVDDNADAAELLAELVGSIGHQVTVAHDATSAIEIAKDFAPQAALLDIGLPVVDGYELARLLRQLPSCADTLLIAITGYTQPEDRERALRAGFAHHLGKPVDVATLGSLLPNTAVKPAR
ncbi:MAG: response regulator [Deltaproteobacteria bacterium]|nr:response regulator [Deltaproteobacteria bacterium]